MQIDKVTMDNFGAYKGRQSVDFAPPGERNITLILGENMRGKTTLLNALRWAFYGKALDRQGEPIPLHKISNREASTTDDDWDFSVRVVFKAKDTRYELTRTAERRQSVVQPTSGDHYRETLHLLKDNQPLTRDQAHDVIGNMLPERVARFFFFDGEMLSEYEKLVLPGSEHGKRIKQAIEHILGVPALTNARHHLSTLRTQATRRLAKDSEHQKALKSRSEQYAELEAQIRAKTADIDELKKALASVKEEIESLDSYLREHDGAAKIKAEIDRREAIVRTLQSEQERAKEEYSKTLKGAWRVALGPILGPTLSSLEKKKEGLHSQIRGRGALDQQIENLQSLLENRSCPTCGADFDGARRNELVRRLEELSIPTREHSDALEQIALLEQRIGRISRVTGFNSEEITDKEKGIRNRQVQITGELTQINYLNQQIQGSNVDDVVRAAVRLRHQYEEKGRLEGDHKKAVSEKDTLAAKQERLSTLMMNDPSLRFNRSKMEVETYKQLETVFSKGLDALRNDLRTTVERQASEVFLKLTTEESYTTLRINENYGLSIIDKNDAPVPIRSAGAEQIVAVALIAGLALTSGKKGPMFMDTPFGRLDRVHRQNILSQLPNLTGQFVLLAHSGEMDQEHYLPLIAARVGAEYEIRRVSESHGSIERKQHAQ